MSVARGTATRALWTFDHAVASTPSTADVAGLTIAGVSPTAVFSATPGGFTASLVYPVVVSGTTWMSTAGAAPWLTTGTLAAGTGTVA